MDAADLSFEELFVGQAYVFERTMTQKDVTDFAILSGDSNPLHTDALYAKTTQFAKPIVHGMLTASLCSQMVGMHLPGRRCLYLAQTLQFKKPVYIGETLHVLGTVESLSSSTRIIQIQIVISDHEGDVLVGKATVQVL